MSAETRPDGGTDTPLEAARDAFTKAREAVDRAESAVREAEAASAERVEGVAPEVDAGWTWRSKLWACPPETRLGVEELAEALGCSPSWIYQRTQKDAEPRLPHRKLSGSLQFVAGEVRAWARKHEEAPVQGPSWSPAEGGLGVLEETA